jgi:hypothetical protein
MKNKYYILLVGLLIFFGCSYPRYKERKDTEYTLYVCLPEYKNNMFKVSVNDTLRYEGEFKNNHRSIVGGDMVAHDMYIGNFVKGQSTKIIVEAQGIENVYECNTLSADSIVILFADYPNPDLLFGLDDPDDDY